MTQIILIVVSWLLVVILLAALLLVTKKRTDGAMVVNHSDPEKDTYRLELYIPFGEIDNKKILRLAVIDESRDRV